MDCETQHQLLTAPWVDMTVATIRSLGVSHISTITILVVGCGILIASLPLAWLWARRPGAFLGVAIVVYCVSQGSWGDFHIGPVNGSQAFVFLVSFAMLGRFFLTSRSADFTPLPTAGIGAHCGLLMYVLIVSIAHGQSGNLVTVSRLGACVLAHYTGYWVARRTDTPLLTYLAVGSLVAAIFLGLDRISADLDALAVWDVYRASGSLGSGFLASVVAILGLPVYATWLAAHSDIKWRVGALIGIVSVGIGVFASLSRSVLLTAVLFGVFVALLGHRSLSSGGSRRPRWAFTAMFALTVFTALYLIPEGFMTARSADIVALVTSGEITGEFGSNRGNIWSFYIGEIGDFNPSSLLIGKGPTSGMDDSLTALGVGVGKDPHNSYIAMMYGYGLIGLLLYATLLISVALDLIRVSRDSGERKIAAQMWLMFFVAYLLGVNMFSSYALTAGSRWLLYFGLGFASARRGQPESSRQQLLKNDDPIQSVLQA